MGLNQTSFSQFDVRLTDLGTPVRANPCLVRVVYTVVQNRFPPSFTNCPTTRLTVRDDAATGTQVIRLITQDLDTGAVSLC